MRVARKINGKMHSKSLLHIRVWKLVLELVLDKKGMNRIRTYMNKVYGLCNIPCGLLTVHCLCLNSSECQ